jgi:DNA-binding transcriptional regulator YiaG
VQIAKTPAQLRRAEERRPAQTQAIQQAQQARAAERTARYEQILELQKHGMKSGEMARTVGMSQRTLQRWITTGTIPYARRKRPRARLIDPYKTYLLKRGPQGCQKASATGQGTKSKRVQRVTTRDLSVSGNAESIDPCSLQAQKRIKSCCLDPAPGALDSVSITGQPFSFSASPQLEVAYQLVDEFLHMVCERAGEQLDSWLNKVEASHLQAFHTFVTGVQKDKEAVLAGLTLPWSTGPLEGHINRGIRS